jgi:hypothetical protein
MEPKIIFFNQCFDKGRLKALISWSFLNFGEHKTLELLEKLKEFGFQFATQGGISLGLDDLKIPTSKPQLISTADIEIQKAQWNWEAGNLTAVEEFQQIIDTWHRTSEILRQDVVRNFRTQEILNPLSMMAFSGARGNISQVRQLVGMRGLMSDPQGQIINFPIRSNFREGLTLIEYIISCYGARKGVVDTALRTANSGYLTRRLVDVAHHVVVSQFDCGTRRGLLLLEETHKDKFEERLVGRVLSQEIILLSGEKIGRNQDICHSLAKKIAKNHKQVLVRSPLICEAKQFICQLCYGWSLAHGNIVSLGEAVGILAAQSIGEPGTQLTMRTFHTGGVFSGDIMNEIRSPITGIIFFPEYLQGKLIRTPHGKIAFLTKVEGSFFITPEKVSVTKMIQTGLQPSGTWPDQAGSSKASEVIPKGVKRFDPSDSKGNKSNKEISSSRLPLTSKVYQESQGVEFFIPSGTLIFVRQNQKVYQKELLVEYASISTKSNQRVQSQHKLYSSSEGEIFFERVRLGIAKSNEAIIFARKLSCFWVLAGKTCSSPQITSTFPKNGDLIAQKNLWSEWVLISPFSGCLELNSNKKLTHPLLRKEKPKQVFLSQPAFHFSLWSIEYKKFGYFISHPKDKNETIFLLTSLKEKKEEFFKTNFFLWFPKISKIGNGKLISKSDIFFDFHEKQGLIFLINQKNSFYAQKKIVFSQTKKKYVFLINHQGFFEKLNEEKKGVLKIQTKSGKNSLKKLQKNSIKKSQRLSVSNDTAFVFKDFSSGLVFSRSFIVNPLWDSTSLKPCTLRSTTQTRVLASKRPTQKKEAILKTQKLLPLIENLFQQLSPFQIACQVFQFSNISLKKELNSRQKFFQLSKLNKIHVQLQNKKWTLLESLKIKNPVLEPIFSSKIFLEKQKEISKKQQLARMRTLVLSKKEQQQIQFSKKSGWFYIPKHTFQATEKHNSLIKKGSLVFEDIFFEQNTVYLECVSSTTLSFLQVKKKKSWYSTRNLLQRGSFLARPFFNELILNLFTDPSLPKHASAGHVRTDGSQTKGKICDSFLTKKKSKILFITNKATSGHFSKFSLMNRPFIFFKKKNFSPVFEFVLKTKNITINPFNKVYLGSYFQLNKKYLYSRIYKVSYYRIPKIKQQVIYALFQKANEYFIPEKTFVKNKIYRSYLISSDNSFSNTGSYINKQFKTFLLKPQVTKLPIFGFKVESCFASHLEKKPLTTENFFSHCIVSFEFSKNYPFQACSFRINSKKKFAQNPNFSKKSLTKWNFFKKNQIRNSLTETIFKANFIYFDQVLEFLVQKEIQICHSSTRALKFRVFNFNSVLAHTPLLIESFLSPYEGEIINRKNNFETKNLLLTFSDQKTFSLENNTKSFDRNSMKHISLYPSTDVPVTAVPTGQRPKGLAEAGSYTEDVEEPKIVEIRPTLKVGQMLRLGDKISNTTAINCSGQIIEIEKQKIVIRKAQPFLASSKSVFHVQHGEFVEKDTLLLTLFYQRLKTGDIVQGIPKIEELFEARQTKQGEILENNIHQQLKTFFYFYKNLLSPKQAVRESFDKIREVLVQEIQQVYLSQGVTISEKHIEIIVRQMTSKVRILDGGKTGLLPDELVDLRWIEVINNGVERKKAKYEPVVLGITKASLEAGSFISAASFQETTRVLTRAAIERKTDFLRGLKENVILGRLVPAGTGFGLIFQPEKATFQIQKK